MSSPFTLTIDWLAFTLPSGSVQDTMQMIGGDWTQSKTGFRGYLAHPPRAPDTPASPHRSPLS